VRRLYAFRRVEMPVFEATEVFARSIGETTDVVSKEMYTFEDRGGDSLTLRPEFTAGIARAYLSNGWQQHAPLKLATHGPAFRYERPQKGRFRQFHQIDAEIIGTDSPQADVELLVMADQLLKELGITEGVTLQLNTLGDADTRDAWRAALVAHFEAHAATSPRKASTGLAKNPLRILDSKDPATARSPTPPRHRRLHDRGRAGLLRRRHRRPRRGASRLDRATPAWSAASITTATPPSNSSPTASARRVPCSAAAAMTGLSKASAAPQRRRSAGRRGSSGCDDASAAQLNARSCSNSGKRHLREWIGTDRSRSEAWRNRHRVCSPRQCEKAL
jgi:hypothetical protein